LFLEKTGKVFSDVITYVLLFVLNPDHRYIEVQKEKMVLSNNSKNDTPTNAGSNLNINAAREYYDREVKRSQAIDEKNRVLLTITALLVAANAIIASNIEPKWLVCIPLIPTMISIFLILFHFDVQSISIPEYEIIDEIKLAESFSKCRKSLSSSNDFRVGIYRASRRSVILSVLLLMIIFIYFAFHRDITTEDKLIKSMKNNIELQFLLRGPQEPAGPKGEQGEEGSQGIQGPPGPTGKVVIVPQSLPDNGTKVADPNNRYRK